MEVKHYALMQSISLQTEEHIAAMPLTVAETLAEHLMLLLAVSISIIFSEECFGLKSGRNSN